MSDNDASSLLTAAAYVNNLLLARGLLRNGAPVDFGHLLPGRGGGGGASDDAGAGAGGGAGATAVAVAQVINLVHDLILRKDRDQEHHESLAMTLRGLRSEAAKQSAEVERLTERNGELSRQLAQSQTAVRAAQSSASAAERSARALREELGRVKHTLEQVRTQCSNDVRKRDLQIQRLKTHLSAQQRGSKIGITGAAISIVSGRQAQAERAKHEAEAPALDDVDYSLQQETTQFLTQLSQNLSDENDTLIALVRDTLNTLKELQGMPHNQPAHLYGIEESETSLSEAQSPRDPLVSAPMSFDQLSTELDSVLGSLRDLLTNPSFAPIEEVQVREDEIQRLRGAWEQMEGRWREAVVLMQGWRQRMLSGGTTVGLEELKAGLKIGEGLEEIRAAAQIAPRPPHSAGDDAAPQEPEEPEDDGSSELESPHLNGLAEIEAALPEVAEGDLVPSEDEGLFNISHEPREEEQSRLREVHTNIQQSIARKRRVSFYQPPTTQNLDAPAGAEQEATEENAAPAPAKGYMRSTDSIRNKAKPVTKVPAPSGKARTRGVPAPARPGSKRRSATEQSKDSSTESSSPLPDPPELRDMTVHEKLQHAAEEARRASLQRLPSPVEPDADEARSDARASPPSPRQPPVRKTRVSGRPKRRKSTLSPEELEQLMLGGK